MEKYTIIDTPWNTSKYLDCLKKEKIKTVVRYYDIHNSHKLPEKRLEKEEAMALSQAGFEIMVVFQALSNVARAFNHELGSEDVNIAYKWAKETIGQPEGSAIYFAVDFYANQDDLNKHIAPYFKAVGEFMDKQDHKYEIGVYGSGLVVNELYQQKLCTYRWLSMSSGFEGTRNALNRGDYELHQVYPPSSICGLDADHDVKKSQDTRIGSFRLP